MSPGVLTGLGYAGVFLASLVSSTPVPFTPEIVVVPLLHAGYAPWAVFLAMLVGTYAGALISYAIGRGGAGLAARRRSVRDSARLERARGFFRRWGVYALFFSWLPIVGDPIAVIGGVMHVPLGTFSFWILLGRGLRCLAVVAGIWAVVT